MQRHKISTLPRWKALPRKRRRQLHQQHLAANRAAAALRGEEPGAHWDKKTTRYFFVDNESGDDIKGRYIDAPPGTTFTDAQIAKVALKTAEELRKRIPTIGNNRRVVVDIKPRSDNGVLKDKSGNPDYLEANYSGYDSVQFKNSQGTHIGPKFTGIGKLRPFKIT